MRHRQVKTCGFDDVDDVSRSQESDGATSSRGAEYSRGHHSGTMSDSDDVDGLNASANRGLPTKLATYGAVKDDTTATTALTTPRSEVASTAAPSRAAAAATQRSRRASGCVFPGVSSVCTQQQQQRDQSEDAPRRSSVSTTRYAAASDETAREAEARRHHRRFLQLCGRLPEKGASKPSPQKRATLTSSAAGNSALAGITTTTTADNEPQSMDGTLSVRYGNGTRGVRERREDEERQRARTRQAERELADTRRRRVSVFDRLIRRPSMRVAPGSRRETQRDMTLPTVYPTTTNTTTTGGGNGDGNVSNPYGAAPASPECGSPNGFSLPIIRTGNGFPQSPSAAAAGDGRRGRSAPLVTVDNDTSQGTTTKKTDSGELTEKSTVAETRTMRPVQRAMQFESGGIIDTFGYFPNHRTNTDYYKKIKREKRERQRRPVEVNRETGAVIATAQNRGQLLVVPPMAEVDVDKSAPGRRGGRRSGAARSQSPSQNDSHSRHTKPRHGRRAGSQQTSQSSYTRTATDGSECADHHPQPSSQRQYRFYTVAEDGAIRGYDIDGSTTPTTANATPAMTACAGHSPPPTTPTANAGGRSGGETHADRVYAETPKRRGTGSQGSAAAAGGAAAAREPAWLADEASMQSSPQAPAFAVRVSEAKPYEDQYGHVVQTRVYPSDAAAAAAAGATESLDGHRRSRGLSLVSLPSTGRDRWGDPLAPPPQTTTVIVRRYTNENSSKPVRLHIPPGSSLEDLNTNGEFPSVSLPWL